MGQSPPLPDAVYLYCVTRAAPFQGGEVDFAAPAIGGRGDAVRIVRHEDLAAVVSTAPRIRYTLRREFLVAHERMIEETMRRADVLPVSFGTLAEDDRQVAELLLRRERDVLLGHLDYVHGRVDLELKVYWNREWLFHEIAREYAEIGALRDHIAGHPADATYFERIRLGELTEQAIHDKREQEADAIVRELAPVAHETRVHRELSDLMVLNASFLVARNREAEFDARVEDLNQRRPGRLVCQYVGPVPPYNFVTVHVSWENASNGIAV